MRKLIVLVMVMLAGCEPEWPDDTIGVPCGHDWCSVGTVCSYIPASVETACLYECSSNDDCYESETCEPAFNDQEAEVWACVDRP